MPLLPSAIDGLKIKVEKLSRMEGHAYLAEQLGKHNISSLSIEGDVINFTDFDTRRTLAAMFADFERVVGNPKRFHYTPPAKKETTPEPEYTPDPVPDLASSLETDLRVRFTSITTEHNAWENMQKGMNVVCAFEINGYRNREIEAAAYFYFKNGAFLMDCNRNYFEGSTGCVSTFKRLRPRYDSTKFTEVRLFIPYEELHLGFGHFDLKAWVGIIDVATGEALGHSDYTHFYFER